MRIERQEAISRIADYIESSRRDSVTRVAIDGITASGKTTLADEIAAELVDREIPVVRLQMDGYHNPKTIRYRQGRKSAMGYFDDAYDFGAFVDEVLVSLGADGPGTYRPAIFDLGADEAVDVPPVRPPDGAVLIVDGSFLQRANVADHWDVTVFVDTSFAEAQRRGVERDREQLGGLDASVKIYEERYHAASRHYMQTCHPELRAHIRLHNDTVASPGLEIRSAPQSGM